MSPQPPRDDPPMDPRPGEPGSAHRRAWDLIPWVVAGRAADDEQALVQAHVAGCADCAEELAFHRAVQQGLRRPQDAPASPAEDARAEDGWQRLQARLDMADDADPATPGGPPGRGTGQGARWRWAAAAVIGAQALGLATLGGMLWERPRPAPYQTLSQPPGPDRAASAARIRLVPAPGLAMAELQALLDRHGLQVVEMAADARYLGLAARPGADPPDEPLLARLRAEPGVLLAEPIGPGPR